MTTNAFLSNVTIEVNVNDAAVSPENYVTIPEVSDVSGVGESKPTVDVTHYASTAREYIAGLAEGNEITVTCNRVHSSPDVQAQIIDLCKNGYNRNMRITITDQSVSPNTSRVYTFMASCLSWNTTPPVGDKVMLTLGFKISDAVTIA